MNRWRKTKIAGLILIGILPAEFNWYYNPRLAHWPAAFWTVDAARFVVLPALLAWWGIASGLFTLSDLGFHTRVCGRRNLPAFVAALVLIPLVICWADPRLVAWAAHVLPPHYDPSRFDYSQVVPPRGPQTGIYRLLAVVYMSLSTAFTEELYFRGMFRRVFGRRWFWSVPFILVSSVVFASVHWYGGPTKILYTFCVGLMLSIAYALTGNLWPLIAAHFLIDFAWLGSAP